MKFMIGDYVRVHGHTPYSGIIGKVLTSSWRAWGCYISVEPPTLDLIKSKCWVHDCPSRLYFDEAVLELVSEETYREWLLAYELTN